ncbi:MAG: TRAP transporter small permease [Deltaproteobacteria bacterium]|nr:TRAP transporter small permease [Deltaproteobacteria bacterium]MBW2017717.1 TRAP transporter small permease [Deltaproteobacteria bacterium]MBW2130311.1 TRAP transporter small permease [Deltaproteobacteria bacterium]
MKGKYGSIPEKLGTGFCILLLILMSLIVIIQVFSRYLFNHSFVWAEELVRYLMIWMVLIGAALVQSKNEHIRIDFFPRMAGARGGRIMDTVFRLCTLFFLTIIIVKGVKSAYFNRLFESSGLRISMIWPYLAIPVGGIFIGIYTATDTVRDLYRLFAWPAEKLEEYDREKKREYNKNI